MKNPMFSRQSLLIAVVLLILPWQMAGGIWLVRQDMNFWMEQMARIINQTPAPSVSNMAADFSLWAKIWLGSFALDYFCLLCVWLIIVSPKKPMADKSLAPDNSEADMPLPLAKISA